MSSGDFTPEMDPNTPNQEWAEFTFTVSGGKYIPLDLVQHNFRNWCKAGFGDVGRINIDIKLINTLITYIMTVQVELRGGNSAADEFYCSSIKNNFTIKFVEPGFGSLAIVDFESRVLAGDEVGKPRAQLVALPTIKDDWLRKHNARLQHKTRLR